MADAGYRAKRVRNWIIPKGSDTTNALRYGTKTGSVTTYPEFVTDGWSARAQIRTTAGGPLWVEMLSSSLTGPRITLDDLGYVTLVLPGTTTEDWPDTRKSGAYDVELIRPDGTILRLVMGTVTVSPEITR